MPDTHLWRVIQSWMDGHGQARRGSVGDYVAAYMAGLARGRGQQPTEPPSLRVMQGGRS